MTNVYITNLVKCRLKDGRKDPRIETECFNQYLNKELSFFMPALAFCFGDQATNGLQRHKQNAHLSVEIISLWHPRARISRERLINENDEQITNTLSSLR